MLGMFSTHIVVIAIVCTWRRVSINRAVLQNYALAFNKRLHWNFKSADTKLVCLCSLHKLRLEHHTLPSCHRVHLICRCIYTEKYFMCLVYIVLMWRHLLMVGMNASWMQNLCTCKLDPRARILQIICLINRIMHYVRYVYANVQRIWKLCEISQFLAVDAKHPITANINYMGQHNSFVRKISTTPNKTFVRGGKSAWHSECFGLYWLYFTMTVQCAHCTLCTWEQFAHDEMHIYYEEFRIGYLPRDLFVSRVIEIYACKRRESFREKNSWLM